MDDKTIADYAEVVVGGTPSTREPGYWGGDVVWVTPTDITKHSGRVLTQSERQISASGLHASSARMVPEGSVLITTRATIGPAVLAGCDLATNQGVTALVPGPDLDGRWLYFWVLANREQFVSRASGNTFPEISRKKTRAIPLQPPSKTQQARIADLMTAADDAAMAALLHAASLRSLARTLRSDAMNSPDADWVRLDEAAEVTMGRQRSPKHAAGEHMVPYLRAANVKDGFLALDDVLQMNFEPDEQAKYRLHPGDVLVTEGCGSLPQIGAAARWNAELDGVVCFQNTLLRLRARDGVTASDYLHQWARWAFESGAFAAVASGTNIFHIGATRAVGMRFPLRPLAAQYAVAGLLEAAEDAAAAASAHHASLERLKASMLYALYHRGEAISSEYDRFLQPAPAELDLVA